MLAVKNAGEAYRQAAPERGREPFSERNRRNHKADRAGRLSMVGCILVAFGALWFVCTKGAEVYSVSYENVKLQTQIQRLAANNASLTAQVDELERPARILTIALNKLHMQYAEPVRISGSVNGK